MPVFDAILPHLPGFILALTRLTGLFIFLPMLSGAMVPRRVIGLFAIALAFVVYPTIDHPSAVPARLDVLSLAPMMATELAIGAVIGIVAAIPLMTAQMAGLVMGQQMGLGLASVFNPSIEIEGDNIGQMLFFVAISGFLIAGGLEVLFGSLVSTFARVPLGGFVFTEAPLELLVGVLTSGFEIALRVAMPVLVILFMENLAMGFIMKTVPSLNIMTFGFPIKIIGGLIIVIASLVVMVEVLMSQIVIDLELIQEWAWSL